MPGGLNEAAIDAVKKPNLHPVSNVVNL